MTSGASRERTRVTNAQARKTALVVACVLLIFAAWSLYRGRTTVAAVVGGFGAALALAGVFVPPAARAFHVGWMRLALALGWINSRVLLSVMFYGVFTPYGFVSRLIARRDPLRRRGKGEESYWLPRKSTRQAREGFERLF